MGKLKEINSFLIEKNDLIDQMLSLTKSIEINTEEDIDNYMKMVDNRQSIIEKIISVDKNIFSKMNNSEEITEELLGIIASMNMTIAKTSGEVIEAENLLMGQIEEMSKDLKKEAKTIVEGRNAKSIYQNVFEHISKIDIKN